MKRQTKITALLVTTMLMSSVASADIAGITGNVFNLTARPGHITLGDGNTLLAWGYGDDNSGSGEMQYPGPTLIVNEGANVTVNLSNTLDEPTSIVFPGQANVAATGSGSEGQMTMEIAAGETVAYTFQATNPGTYMYQSGTHTELQIEMGLVGALIVCPGTTATPTGCNGGTAYGSPQTAYDREYLFFQTDMDRAAHDAVEFGRPVEPAEFTATLWFLNGRNGPDTMHADDISWMPLQPYGALARMKPGDRVLMRLIGAGRDLHPFHHHGNNAWLIAQDGRVLEDGPAVVYPDFEGRAAIPRAGGLPDIPALAPIAQLEAKDATLPNQSESNYTILTAPGSTYDAIWTWTGLGMNWDIYGDKPGHSGAACGDTDPEMEGIENLAAFNATLGILPNSATVYPEDPNSHCKDLEGANGKVVLPEQQAMTFGGLWSGSPYMGVLGTLPPDQGGLNPNGGFSFMWHSHTERELTNDDVFPGGMMTMMIVESPDTPEDQF